MPWSTTGRCEGLQGELRERLCRSIARSAVAEKRPTVTVQGNGVYLSLIHISEPTRPY